MIHKHASLGSSLILAALLAGCVAGSPAAPTTSPAPPSATAALPPTAPPTAAPSPSALAAVPVQAIHGLPAGTDGYPWWNDTVFYEVFVRSFYDSNGDGIGDLEGLRSKLDYLQQ